jgi:MSHA biogenesis protein MshL
MYCRPRIATLNGQKAVLKVGTDEFFVANVTNTTTNARPPPHAERDVTASSGISLTLRRVSIRITRLSHIHPSVSPSAR